MNTNEFLTPNRNGNIYPELGELKLFLHNYFYTNIEIIMQLQNMMQNAFNPLSIAYMENARAIEIKFKKTNIPKEVLNDLPSYYVQSINQVMSNFFINNKNNIDMLYQNLDKKIYPNLTENSFKYLYSDFQILILYNISFLSETVVLIHL